MGWARTHIERLLEGETVKFRPSGHSMTGRVNHKQLVTVVPVGAATLALGDIVLCWVQGNEYLHMIKAVQGERYQIGNNRGGVNGWTGRAQIFGRLIAVET